MANNIPFDFTSFLKEHDPNCTYSITPCTGGLINFTVRATKLQDPVLDDPPSIFPTRSIILKYAPPYIAAIGESAPFSQERQHVEAEALKLFEGPLKPLLDDDHDISSRTEGTERTGTRVCVPLLYHFDHQSHVIAMEDFGERKNIGEWLRVPRDDLRSYARLGEALGVFLGRLHGHFIPSIKTLEPKDRSSFIQTNVIDPVPKILDAFGLSGADRIHDILTRRHSDMDSTTAIPLVFSVGDLWPPSVLLDEEMTKVGIVDWEFATLSPPLQDMAQFGDTSSMRIKDGILIFLNSLHAAHRTALLEHHRTHGSSRWLADPTEPSYADIIRAAWIVHGGELINNAPVGDWPGCVPANCVVEKYTCPIRRRMVEVGRWYVDVAGVDVCEMRRRWDDVVEEQILRPLYLPFG